MNVSATPSMPLQQGRVRVIGWDAKARGIRAPVDGKDGYAMLAPVGRFKPNAFGLHDMLGNAWEWVQDCAIIPYPAQPTDGSAVERTDGLCEKRAVRGASWYTRMDRHRPSFRGADPGNTASHQFGFRVARTL